MTPHVERTRPILLTAPAKLTTSLRIVGVRDDGFHLIDAEMVSVSLADEIHLRAAADVSSEFVGQFGIENAEPNLVTSALRLADVAAHATVTKNIPAGAGLGGGSADAAAILWWAGIKDVDRAVTLGADVAFCLRGGRARVGGIGEQISALPYEKKTFTLLTPPLHCSTPLVYQRWDELGGPLDTEPSNLANDLTAAALSLYPELVTWRDKLGDLTGQLPRLAGSGATWFVEGCYAINGCRVVTTTPARTDT